jgi:hypothetical protein
MRRSSNRRPSRRTRPSRGTPASRQAGNLFDSRRFAESARAYEKISQRTDARRDSRAAVTHFRTGRAYLYAKNLAMGLSHTRRGMTILAAKKQWGALQRFGQRAVDDLTKLGYTQAAQEIENDLIAYLPEDEREQKADARPVLPTECPACGAPVRSSEMRWLDEQTAECLFCGTAIRGES